MQRLGGRAAGWDRLGVAIGGGFLLAAGGVPGAFAGARALAWSARDSSVGRSVALGAACGLAWFGVGLGWSTTAAVDFGVDHPLLAASALVVCCAAVPALAAGLATAAGGGGRAWAAAWGAAGALAWVLPLPGGLAVPLAAWGPLLWPAAALGRPALEIAAGFVAGAPPRVAVGALIVWVAGGAIWWGAPSASAETRIVVLQPDHGRFEGRMPSTAEDRRARVSALVSEAPEADLLVASETAWPGALDERLLSQGRRMILGVSDQGRNEVVAASNGAVVDRVAKQALVPFAERPVWGFGDRLFEAGSGPPMLRLDGLRVGVLVCYEDVLPWSIARVAATRPAVVAAPSSDVWLPETGRSLHGVAARLAAVELGVPVVRAVTSGPSSIVDVRGRVVVETPWIDGDLAVGAKGRIAVGRVAIGGGWWSGALAAPYLTAAAWAAWAAMVFRRRG